MAGLHGRLSSPLPVSREGAPHIVHPFELPLLVRLANILLPPVSISSRFEVLRFAIVASWVGRSKRNAACGRIPCVTIPFTCAACARRFAPAEGGKCRSCGGLFCR